MKPEGKHRMVNLSGFFFFRLPFLISHFSNVHCH